MKQYFEMIEASALIVLILILCMFFYHICVQLIPYLLVRAPDSCLVLFGTLQ